MNADRQLEQQLPTWFAGQTTSAAPELLPRAVADPVLVPLEQLLDVELERPRDPRRPRLAEPRRRERVADAGSAG